jgi:hypothetical protein
MQKIIHTSILTGLLLFASCKPQPLTPEEKLQKGRWEISNVNELQKNYPSNMSIKKAYMEFAEDGTMRTKVGEQVETGTWKLTEDKERIFLRSDSTQYNDTLDYEFVDENTLRVRNQGNDMIFKR